MRRANRECRLHGGKVCCRSPMVSHLFFEDDCLLFCRATRLEVQALKSVLILYEQISGQAINYTKSGTFSVLIHLGLALAKIQCMEG